MKPDDILKRLSNLERKSSCTFSADCPAHDDYSRSLFVDVDEASGITQFYCYQGCSFSEIVHAMGLIIRDCFPPDGKMAPHWDGPIGRMMDTDRALLLELKELTQYVRDRLDILSKPFNEKEDRKKIAQKFRNFEKRELLARQRIPELMRMRYGQG